MINERSKTYGSCLHPRIIKNKYTGDSVYVPCGTCEFCIHNKAIKAELKCNIQLASSKYCEFVTLTYSTEYLPVGQFYQGSAGEVRLLIVIRPFKVIHVISFLMMKHLIFVQICLGKLHSYCRKRHIYTILLFLMVGVFITDLIWKILSVILTTVIYSFFLNV